MRIFLAIITLGLLKNLYEHKNIKKNAREQKIEEERKMLREECMTEAKSKSENPKRSLVFISFCIAEKLIKLLRG